jgi:hypothetical protein
MIVDMVPTENKSFEEIEEVFKEKIAVAETLNGRAGLCPTEAFDTPVDIVEANKYVKYMDDRF